MIANTIIRVLLLEEDQNRRQILREVFTKLGSQILIRWASSIEEAKSLLASASQQGRPFQLVVGNSADFEELNQDDAHPPLFAENKEDPMEVLEVLQSLTAN